MERLLKYHSGPTGYGITRKAQSMPLVTGSYTHEGLAEICNWVKAEHDAGRRPEVVPDHVIRMAVTVAVGKYHKTIEARGLRNLDAGERVDNIAQEQASLIEGMILGWCMALLPWMLANFRFVLIETEELSVVGCTCGLGDHVGDVPVHESRGCHGIGIMNRCDVITERWDIPGSYGYHEFKTVGQAGDWWIGQWETKIQFALGIVGAERRLNGKISEMWVHGLIKGKREGAYDWQTKKKDGPPMQQSVYCYGYRDPGNPPQIMPDWKPKYEYTDDFGATKRVGKKHKKAGIWEPELEIAQEAARQGMSPVEYWLRFYLNPALIAEQYVLVGPLNRQDVLLEEVIEELIAHENGWKDKLWQLHAKREELRYAVPGRELTDAEIEACPDYQALLRFLIQRSWACRRMGQKYECEMVPYCFKQQGWQDLLATGNFIPRRPHHLPELQQAIERGLLPPDEGLADDTLEAE